MNKQDHIIRRFDEVFDLQMGKTPNRKIPSFFGGENVWLSIRDMGAKYLNESNEHITDDAVKASGIKVVKKGTVIMSFKLTVGKCGITSCDLYTNEAILAFNVKKGFSISPVFLYYYLQRYKWQGTNKAVMGLTLNKATISKQIIDIPPLEEQERIVEELNLLSGIIDKKKEQLKAYDQLAQSIFYTMFGDPIDNPKGWETKKLGDISSIGTGATPSREKEELYYGGDISWVKTTEVQNCDITKTEETITQMAIEQTNCRIYPPDTLLMAMYGQGKTRGQIAKLRIHAATNQACAAISLNFNICNLDYIYELLRINYDYIRAMAQGGNQANLNMKLVASIPIILPPLSLQQEFAEKVESIERQKALIRQSIDEVQTMFDYTMDKYFG